MGIICGRLKARPGRIADRHRAVGEFERDIGAGFVDRDDRGILVGVWVAAVPGGVGGDGGEGGARLEGAGDKGK